MVENLFCFTAMFSCAVFFINIMGVLFTLDDILKEQLKGKSVISTIALHTLIAVLCMYHVLLCVCYMDTSNSVRYYRNRCLNYGILYQDGENAEGKPAYRWKPLLAEASSTTDIPEANWNAPIEDSPVRLPKGGR